jgi:1-acyl-sn-glycerol-3-phosphate acyltransferase
MTENIKPGWSLDLRDPRVIKSWMPYWEWFYRYYFKVKSDGWENIPEGKVLFVGSHNGGLAAPDMIMMMYDWFRHFGTERLIYGLMHPQVWKFNPALAKLAAQTGAVVAHPKMAIAAFAKGASVLVYPGGAQDVFRPYWEKNKINFADRRGFIKLALREEVPIVPAISVGAHDSLIVLADFYDLAKKLNNSGMRWLLDLDPQVFPIYLGLPWGLAIGPLPNFPLPVQITTRICEPIIFERYGKKVAGDRLYVEQCYQQVKRIMQRELDILVHNN